MGHKVMTVALTDIRENKIALRSVSLQSEKYLNIFASMQTSGQLQSIAARERTDEDTQEVYYELIDGLHRYTAAKQLGLPDMNLTVLDLDDQEVYEAQIMANIHRVETKPAQYGKQLRRILAMNPMMTVMELASRLGVASDWIKRRLAMNKITNERIVELIDEGQISLGNAFALSKLADEQEMLAFVDSACVMNAAEFVPTVEDRVKELREAARKGKAAAPKEFAPVAHMRKLKALSTVIDSNDLENDIYNLVIATGITDAKEAAMAAIKWVLHLDDASVAEQKAKWDAKEEAKAAAKAKRATEAARKKAEKAAAAATAAEEAAAVAEAS